MNYDELKSLHISRVRQHAAALGLGVSFSEKKNDLIARIVEVQQTIQPKREEKPATIAEASEEQLRSKPAARGTNQKEVLEALQPYVAKGLHVSFPDDESFYISFKKKNDSGTLRQPLRIICRRAEMICG